MDNLGRIVTFYSYKGGAGRSMALANTAWLLASNGKRVLTIDWDLEAPGLPRFFQPFINDRLLASSPGLIDLFTDYSARARTPVLAVPSIDQAPLLESTDVEEYVVRLNWNFGERGCLDLLPAGKPGPAYARNVTQFDWQQLYGQLGGHQFIEGLRTRLRTGYDYVLIDSRTGINDTSGICTVQMPDTLVICFSLNRQSIEGAARVAESVDAQRRLSANEPRLQILPIPTRVEDAERDKLDAARTHFQAKFGPFLSHMSAETIPVYWSSVEIPSVPFYAYEEILCPFHDNPDDPKSMLAAIQRFTSYLTRGEIKRLPEIGPEAQARVLSAFSQLPQERPPGTSCFISYSSKDSTFAEQLRADLQRSGVRCWFAPHDLAMGAKIRPGIDRAIRDHDRVILILSAASISSSWVEKEVETAFEREAVTGQVALVPVRLDEAIMQAQEGWAADVRRQRHVGDFTGWQNKEFYAAALSRLISSLETRL